MRLLAPDLVCCVCLSVGHNCEPCKNGKTEETFYTGRPCEVLTWNDKTARKLGMVGVT